MVSIGGRTITNLRSLIKLAEETQELKALVENIDIICTMCQRQM